MSEKAILLAAAVQMYIARNNGRLDPTHRLSEGQELDLKQIENEGIKEEYESLFSIFVSTESPLSDVPPQ